MDHTDLADIDLLDDDGYPTDEALHLIPRWTGRPLDLMEDVLAPIFDRYGVLRHDWPHQPDPSDPPVHLIRISTGGWSGNEEALTALRRGGFWFLYWESSNRGGAHTFHIPDTAFRAPMIDWPVRPSIDELMACAYNEGYARAEQDAAYDSGTGFTYTAEGLLVPQGNPYRDTGDSPAAPSSPPVTPMTGH